jgi:hypothetical protein
MRMGARRSDEPTAARLQLWLDSVSSATLPVLAAFSTTSVIVVTDDLSNFRWQGATVFAFTAAAVTLIAAVQFAYHARMSLPESPGREDGKGSRVSPRDVSQSELDTRQKSQNLDSSYILGLTWTRRTRWAYDIGLLALLAGLGLAVAPYRDSGAEAAFRWLASAGAFVACALELLWTVVDPLLRTRREKH